MNCFVPKKTKQHKMSHETLTKRQHRKTNKKYWHNRPLTKKKQDNTILVISLICYYTKGIYQSNIIHYIATLYIIQSFHTFCVWFVIGVRPTRKVGTQLQGYLKDAYKIRKIGSEAYKTKEWHSIQTYFLPRANRVF